MLSLSLVFCFNITYLALQFFSNCIRYKGNIYYKKLYINSFPTRVNNNILTNVYLIRDIYGAANIFHIREYTLKLTYSIIKLVTCSINSLWGWNIKTYKNGKKWYTSSGSETFLIPTFMSECRPFVVIGFW